MQVQEKFEQWAIIELFGHAKIAGHASEQNIGGVNMVRVDVPETETQPAFTRFFGGNAIYSINPCDEETVRHFVKQIQAKPVESYSMNEMIRKQVNLQVKALTAGTETEEIQQPEFEDDDNDPDDLPY